MFAVARWLSNGCIRSRDTKAVYRRIQELGVRELGAGSVLLPEEVIEEMVTSGDPLRSFTLPFALVSPNCLVVALLSGCFEAASVFLDSGCRV